MWKTADELPTNCLSVFDHFVGLALNGLIYTLCIIPFLLIFDYKETWNNRKPMNSEV